MEKQSAKYQYLVAVVVNILTITYGVSVGWCSPNVILLMSDKTPLPSGKLTIDEISWITSLTNVGGLTGNVIFGVITSHFGRKRPLMCMAPPTIIGWLLILFAPNVYFLYAARFINGFVSACLFVIIPLFLSEIAIDRARGALGSFFALCDNVGILIAFILGNYCDYNTTPKFVIGLAIIFVILFYFFPESPTFLLKQKKTNEAEESIRFYRNLHRNSRDNEILQQEMIKLRNSLNTSNNDKNNDESISFNWSDLVRNPGRKAFIIGIVLSLVNQLCGCFAILNYTANIFEESGSNLSPNTSAIVVGVIQLLGSYVATILVDRAGRKFLFAVSTIGTALGLITLGIYMMLKSWNYDVNSYNWIPIASLSFALFVACLAILSLPYLIMSEVLPEKIKDFCASFCITIVWICAFIVTKYLPLLNEMIGFHGSMFLFAGVCLFGTLFVLFYMPETKGRSYEQIMISLQ